MQDARRWVVDACTAIGRPELAECAELGVSELVTNALLHGEQPIQVRVRGTQEHPRIEVRDASRERPVLPTVALDDDAVDDEDLLLTFGRGLSIVARSSQAWGADIDEDGKVVWFAPAATFADSDGVTGVLTGPAEDDDPGPGPVQDPVLVRLLGVPMKSYLASQRHFRELRREVRLLALAHESDYPLAKNLSDLFGTLERQMNDSIGGEQVEAALAEGRAHADLGVEMGRETTVAQQRFLEILDLADEFCRAERLLSLARSPEQVRFQRWFLGEFVRQGQGETPVAWSDASSGRRTSVS